MRAWPRWLPALLGVVWLAHAARAQQPPPVRFLFVVEVSQEMTPRKPATVKTIRDLIQTGFHNRIREGEQFGIWVVSDSLKTNVFPIQTWRESERIPQADLAATFVKTLSSSEKIGPRAFGLALSNAASLSSPLTLFLVGDGYQPLSGPFSKEINATFEKSRFRLHREKKPFLTTLIHLNGERMAWGVHAAAGVVSLPNVPVPPEQAAVPEVAKSSPPQPAAAPPAVAVVDTPAPKPILPPAETAPAAPVIKEPEVAIAKPTPEPALKQEPALPKVEAPPESTEKPALTLPVARLEPPPTPPPSAPVVVPPADPQPQPKAEPPPEVVEKKPTAPPVVLQPQPEPPKNASPLPEPAAPAIQPQTKIQHTNPIATTLGSTTSKVEPRTGSPVWKWLAAAAVAVGVGSIILTVLGRRKPAPRSLISQSLPDKR